jgi:membrane-bound lytic murein transglycosylase D
MILRRILSFTLVIFVIAACSHLPVEHPVASEPDQDQVSPEDIATGESENASTFPPIAEDAVVPPFQPHELSEQNGTDEALAAPDGEPTSAGTPDTDDRAGGDSLRAEKKTQPALDVALELCQLSQEYWQKGDLDNAVNALDQAYAMILNVDTSDQPKLIQQKEDLRFMISKRILEIYASRNIVVNGNHNAIPVIINRHVQSEINSFTTGGERAFFIRAYRRSGRFRPRIVASLKAAGLPEELSWLPLIESGYNVKALSRSRALGLWQFIPSTGYKFGLSRDKYIDERMDPEKSTTAAIDYLKELHGIFGDWSTVLAAYNCGEGRVLRVIKSQRVNYLDNFWDLYERLPRETARYVPRFLATLHIIQNPEKYGLDQVEPESPYEYETLMVSKQIHLKNVAKYTGTSLEMLKALNPELRYAILPGDHYQLRIPPGSSPALLASLPRIPVSKPPQRAFVYHRVRSGETLSTIARRHRTSVRRIMRANNLRRSNYIVAGKLLKIPKSGWVSSAPRKPQQSAGKALRHRVRKGDSLWIIAQRYGTTTKRIKDLNGLKTNDLSIGQVLLISPGKQQRTSEKTMVAKSTYRVQPGDSPFIIAKRHNMSLERLLDINQLSDRTTIYPGQELHVD